MDSICEICRRQGEKLFLKGEKCYTSKCPLVRKPYPPGVHGRASLRAKRAPSEYGAQLREKQKLKFFYGLREKQFKNYVKDALKKKAANKAEILLTRLESRLDNVVFKLGWAASRSIARQIVSHNHILVNGRNVNIPSYELKTGNKIAIKPSSLNKKIFRDLDITLKKYKTPSWLSLNPEAKKGQILGKPQIDDLTIHVNAHAIIEFYSR